MKTFALFSACIFMIYAFGFIKPIQRKPEWMSREYTTALKGFAILTVVWAHGSARLGIGGIQFIAGVGVSLFLICSGYGLQVSVKKNGINRFWTKRLLNVAIPFWIVEAIGLLITGNSTIREYVLDFYFIKPATAYGWFMQYIILCYILFWLTTRLEDRTKLSKEKMLYVAFTMWFVIDSFFFADLAMPFLKAEVVN